AMLTRRAAARAATKNACNGLRVDCQTSLAVSGHADRSELGAVCRSQAGPRERGARPAVSVRCGTGVLVDGAARWRAAGASGLPGAGVRSTAGPRHPVAEARRPAPGPAVCAALVSEPG